MNWLILIGCSLVIGLIITLCRYADHVEPIDAKEFTRDVLGASGITLLVIAQIGMNILRACS